MAIVHLYNGLSKHFSDVIISNLIWAWINLVHRRSPRWYFVSKTDYGWSQRPVKRKTKKFSVLEEETGEVQSSLLIAAEQTLCCKTTTILLCSRFLGSGTQTGHRRGGLSALRCLGPPMRRLKWLSLAQMPRIIQRCLHSHVWRFVLAVSWDLSWSCWQGHHHSGLSDVTGFPHNMAAGFWGTARGEWVFQKTEAETGQLLLT